MMMQPQALFFAVRFTVILAILSVAAAVVTANADSHLPDCKADAGCLSKLEGNWKPITAADMQAMIDDGADVNAKNNDGETPLHFATWQGHAKVISILIKVGADVHAKDKFGWTPLLWAAGNGNAEAIPVLVKVGADVNAKDHHGWTPLDIAKKHKHWAAIKALEAVGGKCNKWCSR